MDDIVDGGRTTRVGEERLTVDVAWPSLLDLVPTEGSHDSGDDVLVCHRRRDHEVVDSSLAVGAVQLHDARSLLL